MFNFCKSSLNVNNNTPIFNIFILSNLSKFSSQKSFVISKYSLIIFSVYIFDNSIFGGSFDEHPSIVDSTNNFKFFNINSKTSYSLISLLSPAIVFNSSLIFLLISLLLKKLFNNSIFLGCFVTDAKYSLAVLLEFFKTSNHSSLSNLVSQPKSKTLSPTSKLIQYLLSFS